MNQIIKKQNDEKLLKIQYSARVCYNFAEIINVLVWCLCILGFILTNVTALKDFLGWLFPYISAVLTWSVFICGDILSSKAICLGAAFKKYFDYCLFDLSTDNYCGYSEMQLIEKSLCICKMRKKDSEMRTRNTGTDKIRGVKDWYTGTETYVDGSNLIFKCQTQNVWFDQKISNIQKWFFRSILIITIITLIVTNYKNTVEILMLTVLTALSLILKTIKELRSYKNFDKLMIKIDVFNNKSNIDNNDIKHIQSYIDERRSMNFVSINKIHDILSTSLHERYSDINN